MHFTIRVVFVTMQMSVVAFGGEERPTIDALITGLRNSNRMPSVDGIEEGGTPFPKGYNWNERERVRDNWEELHARFEEALPILVKHATDTEYAVTYMNGYSGAWRNATVGDVCLYIIHANVEPFSRPSIMGSYSSVIMEGPPNDKGAGSKKLSAGVRAQRWWAERSGQSLQDLQLEAVRWARAHPSDRMLSALKTEGEKKNAREKEADRLNRWEASIIEKGARQVRTWGPDEMFWGDSSRTK